jgi:hypothetical protein
MDYGPFAITPDVISNQPTFTTWHILQHSPSSPPHSINGYFNT